MCLRPQSRKNLPLIRNEMIFCLLIDHQLELYQRFSLLMFGSLVVVEYEVELTKHKTATGLISLFTDAQAHVFIGALLRNSLIIDCNCLSHMILYLH